MEKARLRIIKCKEKNCIKILGVENFNPTQIFESGQCFRWKLNSDGFYEGVAAGRVLEIKHMHGDDSDEEGLLLRGTNEEEFMSFWYDYFDLGRDYTYIKSQLSELDPIMAEAISYGSGLRILRQEFWETLISFIMSSNNMIPRISKSVEILASEFGSSVVCKRELYSFPDCKNIYGPGLEGINICRGGFRCKYLLKAAEMMMKGEINETHLRSLSTDEARRELMKVPGVGAKVADCVLLYSGISFDVFPVDVWVKRVMEALYFKREASLKEINEFSLSYFGKLAGFAQLYLFYYARKNNIGKDKHEKFS